MTNTEEGAEVRKTVHQRHYSNGARCSWRYSLPRYQLTDNRIEVTCARCLAYLEFDDKRRHP